MERTEKGLRHGRSNPQSVEEILRRHEEKVAELVALTKPVMEWIADNYPPHARVIITPTNVEVVEGMLISPEVTDHLHD